MKSNPTARELFRRKMLALLLKHKDEHDPEGAASDIDKAFADQLISSGFAAGVRIAKKIKTYR